MKCIHTRQIWIAGTWYCKDCETVPNQKKMRVSLTEYQRLKLSWYKDEKKWVDNIRDRKTVVGRNGEKITVSQGRVMPTR